MRLFLLPISTRRTLIYCQKLNHTTSQQTGYLDKATDRAALLWANWEKRESGWQKKVVDLGNKALQRIPYEEWGLKSIPPLSRKNMEEETSSKMKIEVSFPSSLIPQSRIPEILQTLGTEREDHHRKRILYCFIGMPIVAPFALVPVIPNLPFFYLVYRAWSHWRAYSGSKHIQFLLKNNLAIPRPSPILDTLYAAGIMQNVRNGTVISSKTVRGAEASLKAQTLAENEYLVLDKWNAALIAKALAVPELEVELERAIWQVESTLKATELLNEEKERLEKSTRQSEAQEQEQEKK